MINFFRKHTALAVTLVVFSVLVAVMARMIDRGLSFRDDLGQFHAEVKEVEAEYGSRVAYLAFHLSRPYFQSEEDRAHVLGEIRQIDAYYAAVRAADSLDPAPPPPHYFSSEVFHIAYNVYKTWCDANGTSDDPLCVKALKDSPAHVVADMFQPLNNIEVLSSFHVFKDEAELAQAKEKFIKNKRDLEQAIAEAEAWKGVKGP